MILGPLLGSIGSSAGPGGGGFGFSDSGDATSGATLGSVMIGGVNPPPPPKLNAVSVGVGLALATGAFFLARKL